MPTYAELKARRNEIQTLLNAHSDLKGHRTYKKLEADLHNVKKQISEIFRQQHHKANGNAG